MLKSAHPYVVGFIDFTHSCLHFAAALPAGRQAFGLATFRPVFSLLNATLAQLVEQPPCKRWVVGSSPTGGSTLHRGVAQLARVHALGA